MKKIMFNDRYELTQAVLSGRKISKRRQNIGNLRHSRKQVVRPHSARDCHIRKWNN